MRYIICLRLAIRLCILIDIIGIHENDTNCFWHSRDIQKRTVMTLAYKSTSYGRKNFAFDHLRKLKQIPDKPLQYSKYYREFVSFIDRYGSAHLRTIKDLDLINLFLVKSCKS